MGIPRRHLPTSTSRLHRGKCTSTPIFGQSQLHHRQTNLITSRYKRPSPNTSQGVVRTTWWRRYLELRRMINWKSGWAIRVQILLHYHFRAQHKRWRDLLSPLVLVQGRPRYHTSGSKSVPTLLQLSQTNSFVHITNLLHPTSHHVCEPRTHIHWH